MAAKKKAAKKKAAKRKTAKRKTATGALARIEAELPKTLRGYVQEIEKRLNRLEKDIEKAGASARRSSAKLLRDASRRIGALEQQGEAALRRVPYRREAIALMHKLEKSVAPARKSTKKKAAKKKTAKKKATKKKAASKRTAKKKTAKRKTTKRKTATKR